MSIAAADFPSPLERPAYNPWVVAVVITLATFMELLDTSIANVALPHMAGSLGADASQATWVLTSYLVANAVVLPLSAWMSTLMGRKRFYMLCVALFTISSLLCSLATSLGWLVFFRVLQGIGGGGLAPSEQAMLVDAFPPARRAAAFAIYSIAIVAAPAIGPTLGGWLTDNYSWHWCFLINVPIGLLSLMLTGLVVPAGLGEVKKKLSGRIDFLGILLVAIGFGCLEVVLDTGQEYDWFSSTFVTSFAVAAVVGLVLLVIWETLVVKEPVVEFQLLKYPNFALSCVLYFMIGFVLFGSTVLLPQMFQSLFGYTATDAGMILSPGALVIMFMAPIVGKSMKHLHAKYVAAAGFFMVGVSLWLMQGFDFNTDYRTAVFARIVQGFGMAMMFIPVSQIAYSYLPREKNTQASSLTNLFRNLGGSFGIAFVATMLSRRSQTNQTTLVSHITPFDTNVADRISTMTQQLHTAGLTLADAAARAQAQLGQTVARQAQMLAFLDVIRLLMLIAVVAAVIALFVRKFSHPAAGAGGGH